MDIQKRTLNTLNPAEYNPRQDLKPGDPEYEKIKRSIKEFGYVDPIIINRDGTIIGGHQRYKILIEMGETEADVSVVDLNKEHEKALNIALNKTGGDWDQEKLKELLKDLDLSGLDMSLTGFKDQELKDLIGDIDIERELSEDEDYDFKETVEHRAEYGNVFVLGNHRLMCGDSSNIDDVDRLVGGCEQRWYLPTRLMEWLSAIRTRLSMPSRRLDGKPRTSSGTLWVLKNSTNY